MKPASAVGSLFDQAPYNYSEGSKAGAVAVVASGAAGVQLSRVLELIERAGQEGTTRKDIAVALSLPESTIAARVHTLKGRGQVQEFTGARRRYPKVEGANVRQGVLVAVAINAS
jgi:predicted transcriptional regulator